MSLSRLFLLTYALGNVANVLPDKCQDDGDHACMSTGSSLLTLNNGIRIEHQQGMPKQGDQASRINSTRFALLLTTFNEPKRTEMYAKRLEWWLRQIKLPIYVVDSGNLPFPKSLEQIRDFRVLHFDQTRGLGTPPPWTLPATEGELFSLKMAHEAFKDEWAQYDYVVKVTGKYVLPELEANMAAVKPNTDFVIQMSGLVLDENVWLPRVGTEYIGFNSQRMSDLLMEIENFKLGCLEQKLGVILAFRPQRYVQLPMLSIPEEYRVPCSDGRLLTRV